MRRIVRKAIAVDPECRYHHAWQMCEDLARVCLVDWSAVLNEPDRRLWEGTSSVWKDRLFRVEAVRKKGRWVLTASKHVTRWTRFYGPEIVSDLGASATTAFFDHVVSEATSR
jgi:hypothetical protein